MYRGNWEGYDYGVQKLIVKGDSLKYIVKDDDDEWVNYCKIANINIGYSVKNNRVFGYNVLAFFLYGFLPNTLIGEQELVIKCKNKTPGISHWQIDETIERGGTKCISFRIYYIRKEGEYQDSIDGEVCRFD
ncbi:MAG: hypothetical protein L3J83_10505 [Proteobacteria bacterium]|nr:hypothetical protein [Pseudomonadota bacterium]